MICFLMHRVLLALQEEKFNVFTAFVLLFFVTVAVIANLVLGDDSLTPSVLQQYSAMHKDTHHTLCQPGFTDGTRIYRI